MDRLSAHGRIRLGEKVEGFLVLTESFGLLRWPNRQHRKPLCKLVSRKVKSKDYKTSLPGAPEGEYVVIQFKTSFENKKRSIETVTPMIDDDGKWRVSGYYIK